MIPNTSLLNIKHVFLTYQKYFSLSLLSDTGLEESLLFTGESNIGKEDDPPVGSSITHITQYSS